MSDSPPHTDGDGTGISRRSALQAAATGAGALLTGTSLTGSTLAVQEYPPEYDDIDVIREEVWVETGTDTDDSGKSDRAYVSVVRPAKTDEDGEQLPAVVRPDPYYTPMGSSYRGSRPPYDAGTARNSMEIELYRPDEDDSSAAVASTGTQDTTGMQESTGTETTSVTPGGYTDLTPGGYTDPLYERATVLGEIHDDYFFYEQKLVPRDYVFVHVSPIGSFKSTGCSVCGGQEEIQSVKAVVDWLNGRATAYGSRDGDETVTADWTTGKAGMIGGSYRGSIAMGVAETGVDGLETIVPVRALSSWYNYTRSNGAVASPTRDGPSIPYDLSQLTGVVTTRKGGEACEDTLERLAENLARDSGNYTEFWKERDYVDDAENLSASVLLVHGLYDPIVRPRNFSRWLGAMKRNDVPYRLWLSQGKHDEPKEEHPDRWRDLYRQWFDYWLKDEDNGVMDEPTALVERQDDSWDEQSDWPHPESEQTAFQFQPPGEQMGGLALDAPEESVTESLVDNSDIPPTEFLEGENTDNRLVYRTPELGESVHVSGTFSPRFRMSFDSAAALVSVALVDYGPEEPTIVNRGWMNANNRESREESLPIEPGEVYDIEFPAQPVDYVFEEGHQFGIVVYSSDYNVTKRPPSSPELTLHLEESAIDIPVVGGESAVTEAVDFSELEEEETPTPTQTETPTETPTATPTETATESEPTATPAETATETAEETESANGDGPGFGIVSALSGLGGAGYLLKRRFGSDDNPAEEP
jgi:X-Pro dipeptidyl-peptidase